MWVGAQTGCPFLHCDLRAAQMNVIRSVIRELILYEFELDHNITETTKNICCEQKWRPSCPSAVIIWLKKFQSGFKELQRSPKTIDSEAGLKSMKSNMTNSTQRVLGRIAISLFPCGSVASYFRQKHQEVPNGILRYQNITHWAHPPDRSSRGIHWENWELVDRLMVIKKLISCFVHETLYLSEYLSLIGIILRWVFLIWELIFIYLWQTFCPHLGSFLCFFFHYVSARFHLWPSSGDLPRPRIGMMSLVTVSPVITAFHSCCLSHHVFDQVNLWPAWVGFENAIFWQCSPGTVETQCLYPLRRGPRTTKMRIKSLQ